MDLQDVAFRPFQVSFSTIFLNNCGRGESLRIVTCLTTVVGVSKGMLRVGEATFTPMIPIFLLVKFHQSHMTVTELWLILLSAVFGNITGFRTMMFVCSYAYILHWFCC